MNEELLKQIANDLHELRVELVDYPREARKIEEKIYREKLKRATPETDPLSFAIREGII